MERPGIHGNLHTVAHMAGAVLLAVAASALIIAVVSGALGLIGCAVSDTEATVVLLLTGALANLGLAFNFRPRLRETFAGPRALIVIIGLAHAGFAELARFRLSADCSVYWFVLMFAIWMGVGVTNRRAVGISSWTLFVPDILLSALNVLPGILRIILLAPLLAALYVLIYVWPAVLVLHIYLMLFRPFRSMGESST